MTMYAYVKLTADQLRLLLRACDAVEPTLDIDTWPRPRDVQQLRNKLEKAVGDATTDGRRGALR